MLKSIMIAAALSSVSGMAAAQEVAGPLVWSANSINVPARELAHPDFRSDSFSHGGRAPAEPRPPVPSEDPPAPPPKDEPEPKPGVRPDEPPRGGTNHGRNWTPLRDDVRSMRDIRSIDVMSPSRGGSDIGG